MASGYEGYIWSYFMKAIGNEYGVAGLMGNLQAESGLHPDRKQGDVPYSSVSQEYTAKVDSGEISETQFVNDSIGYGLAQWTFYTRKQALYNMYKKGNYTSIGSVQLACDYLKYELENDYPSVYKALKNAKSIRIASNKVLHDFESPADQSSSVEVERTNLGRAIYDEYSGSSYGNSEEINTINHAVGWAVAIANDDTHGYSQIHRYGPDYDCASLLIQAWEEAGVPVKTNGASYTKDFYSGFIKSGFVDVTDQVNFIDGTGFMKGDILLNPDWHVEMMISDSERVGAHSDYDGVTGDSSGNEINIKPYANYSTYGWTHCLRYGKGYLPIKPTNKRGMKKLFLYAVASDCI